MDAISNISNLADLAKAQSIVPGQRNEAAAEAAQQEFLAIFYAELLKQAFKAPQLGADDTDEPSGFGSMHSDMFVDQMALELARKSKLGGMGLINESGQQEKNIQ